MSDSPPKDDAVPGPAQTANAATETNSEAAKSETAAQAAGGAMGDAAKAMDAVVVKPDVPPSAAAEIKSETTSETKNDAKDTAKAAEPAKQPGFTLDPKPVVDIMQLSANTSGMHQQYVAPGVQRQSLLSSTKYQFFFFGALMLLGFFVLRGGIGIGGGGGDAFGLQDPNASSTKPASSDPQSGFPNPNNENPPPLPQADFTVNAGAIGNPIAPTTTVRKGDGGANKGGYAEETADLEAARLMVDKDPNKALQMCDQHDIDYPRGMLDPEARVIRVEAYAKKGEDAKALALGNDFLEDYPHSPRAQRVVAIVEALKNKLDAGSH